MRLFVGTRFWKPQWVGLIGALCLLLALIGPLLQYTSMMGTRSWLDISFPTNGPSLLGAPDIIFRVCAYIILLLAAGSVWALLNLRFAILPGISLAILIISFLLASTGIKNIDVYDQLSPSSLVPAYFPMGQRVSLGWAWGMLLIGPLILWLASRFENEPSEAQRAQLIANTPPFTLQDVISAGQNSAPSPGPSPSSKAAQSTTAGDTGFCSACGARNSIRITKCHACGAVLPWEELRQSKATGAAKARKTQLATSGGSAGQVLLLVLQVVLIFWLCATAPLLGYFLWRYLSNEDSKFAGLAFWSSIGGAVIQVLAVLSRFL